jgi:Beta-propeller repeat
MNWRGWPMKREVLALVVGLVSVVGVMPSGLLSAGETFSETPAVKMSPPSITESPSRAQVRSNYGQLPLHFEANQGQTDSQVKFLARSSGSTLFLTSNEVLLRLQQADKQPRTFIAGQWAEAKRPKPGSFAAAGGAMRPPQRLLRLRLADANPAAQVMGVEELPGKTHYLFGNDATRWRTHIPTYGQVHYRNVFPGIDLFLRGHQQQLEYIFVVAPGADPRRIALVFAEMDAASRRQALQLDADGHLRPRMSPNAWYLGAPRVFQDVDGGKRDVAAVYRLRPVILETGGGEENTRIDVHVDSYDASKPLMVTLGLAYSTYLGGGDAEIGVGIAVDSSGHAYITGSTSSADFPKWPMSSQPIPDSSGDVFVTKLNPTGTALIYSMFLGGSESDGGTSIAVDDAGHAYVTGRTSSLDFPATPAAFQPEFGGGSEDFFSDGFVAKLTADGSGLVYASYLGGSEDDLGTDIAVHTAGYAYVTGQTSSTDFPTTPDTLQSMFGGGFLDAFVAKIDVDGSTLVYASYLGGSSDDAGRSVAVDAIGSAYIVGDTDSEDFPTGEGPSLPPFSGASDAFVAKIDVEGAALLRVTYIGGRDSDFGAAVALDADNYIYVTGSTFSRDLPITTGSFQADFGGGFLDAFVAKLQPDGAELIYVSYLGGSADDVGDAMAVDTTGHAYVTGLTESTDFPTRDAMQSAFAGSFDAFVTKVAPDGAALVYSTYLGGSAGDRGFAIAVDAQSRVYVTGLTESTDFMTAHPLQPTSGGVLDAFVTQLAETFNASCQEHGDAILFGMIRTDADQLASPMEGITAVLLGPDDCRDMTVTNAVGLYWFRALDRGTYTVTPEKEGCVFDPPSQTIDLVRRTARTSFTGSCP